MSVDRRGLLLGSVGVTSLMLAGGVSQAAPNAGLDGFPMPRPSDAVPEPLPVEDPSRLLLADGWLFHEGDVVPPPLSTHDETYGAAKAGGARGAAAIDFDDSKWQPVRVPHDWASFQPFVETANVSQGYRPRGIGWYRRTIRLDPADRGKAILLQFGAIATHATIWVIGSVVAHNW